MKQVAAKDLGCDSSAISIKDAKVLRDGSDTGLSWSELVSKTYMSRVPLWHTVFTRPQISISMELKVRTTFSLLHLWHLHGRG